MAFLLYLTAVVLSGIAAYYSVIGLIAIFSSAAIPVAIMGSSLEVAKLVVASWLYRYWNYVPILMRMYFTSALVILMLITSMGIFGFLSKAHNDQNLVSGDVLAKIAVYDEKIKTQRDNIEAARRALAQMDAQVDARLARSDSETGAERAVQIRRQQAGERIKLQKEIADAQKVIAQLNEERAPIAAEVRKVEAEVGPIKYIAGLIYGDSADVNTLEKAVTWLIIILIFVFDPLAVLMLIAANLTQMKQQELKKINANIQPTGQTEDSVAKEIKNDDAYKIIPDQVVVPVAAETAQQSITLPIDEPIVAADTTSVEPTAPVEKVGVKKSSSKPVANSNKNKVQSKKQKLVKKVEPIKVKKQPSKKKTTNSETYAKVEIKEEPIVVTIQETVESKINTVQEQAVEDKSLSEGFIPQPASIQDQVQQMIEVNDQQGLEQVYKQIVKELTKKNRSKTTHWGPIKNTRNG